MRLPKSEVFVLDRSQLRVERSGPREVTILIGNEAATAISTEELRDLTHFLFRLFERMQSRKGYRST